MRTPSPSDPRSSRKERPVNYQSRGVQMRIMALVFSMMLVLVLMNEARKPDNWRWMWSGEAGQHVESVAQGVQESGLLSEPVDNRTASRPQTPEPSEMATIEREFAGAVDSDDPYLKALSDGWAQLWEDTSRDQHFLLYQALMAARSKQAGLGDSERAALPGLIEVIDKHWLAYFERARDSLSTGDLSAAEQAGWTELIDQLASLWSQTKNALQALADQQQPDQLGAIALAETQGVLDALALSRVDDSAQPRGFGESEAWFRLLERLQTAPTEELAKESIGYVGFVQLTSQPKEYRGKVVSLRGSASLGYRVSAPKNNLLGIEDFYVLWIKPATGENAPIVVYTLELPEGFPEIPPREEQGETVLNDEKVELVGYFFKRWVYPARQGVRDAPLVLANSFQWERRDPSLLSQPPSFSGMIVAMLVACVFALGVALFAYQSSRWRPSGSRATEVVREQVKAKLGEIDDDEVSPGPGEMLRRLAEEEEA